MNYEIIEAHYFSGEIRTRIYWLDDNMHRLDGPARIGYYRPGGIKYEKYFVNGMRSRLDGPADIYYYESGEVQSEIYFVNDIVYYIGPDVHGMRQSNNKTETLMQILNITMEPNFKKLLINMFRSEIDPNVLNNLDIFF